MWTLQVLWSILLIITSTSNLKSFFSKRNNCRILVNKNFLNGSINITPATLKGAIFLCAARLFYLNNILYGAKKMHSWACAELAMNILPRNQTWQMLMLIFYCLFYSVALITSKSPRSLIFYYMLRHYFNQHTSFS